MSKKKNKKRTIAPVVLSAAMLATSVFTPAAFAAEEKSDNSGTDIGVVSEAVQYYNVEVTGDRGVDLANTKVTVEAGGETSIEADAAIGFNITKVRLNDGTHMETAPVGTGQLLLDGKVYRIDEADGRVAVRLTNVQSNIQIHFFAEMDENYKPANQPFCVSISGEQGVKIDKAVNNIVRGDDVDATAYAAPGYQLTKVRLEDGTHSETAVIAGKRIVLNGKAYAIENDDGYIKVHLTDIQSDIKVYFYADPIKGWGPGYPGWYPSFPDDWRPGWTPGDGTVTPTDPNARQLNIDISGTIGVEIDNPSSSVARGGNINIVAKAKNNYSLTKIRVSDGVHTETTNISAGYVWLGSNKYIIDKSGDKVTLRLTDVQNNISVYFFTNAADGSADAIPYGYQGITLIGDKGVKGDDKFLTVKKGNSTDVTAEAKSGYKIIRVRVDYGDYQKTAYVSDGRIEINGKTYRIDRDDNAVTIRFTNVRDDIVVRFYTDYDSSNWDCAVNVTGDKGVAIENDTLHVENGDDVNVVADAADGYKITSVSLDDGKRTATAKVSAGRIVLSGKSYTISTASNGRVTVRLKDVQGDIDVSFTATVDENRIPMKVSDSSTNCSISASTSFVKKGDSVIYTVVPACGYALNSVTVRIGDKTGTASAKAGMITVGNKTYRMQLAQSGTLTVTITDVQDEVEVSAATINTIPDYSLNPQFPNGQYPNSPSINHGQYSLYLRYDVTTPYIQGYGNGLFGPKNTLSRAEAAVMLFHQSRG